MKMTDWNRQAVRSLLADADRVLALSDLTDVRGNREIVDDAIANARKNYLDLMRRRIRFPQCPNSRKRKSCEAAETTGCHRDIYVDSSGHPAPAIPNRYSAFTGTHKNGRR
jgi:hypothetical protein